MYIVVLNPNAKGYQSGETEEKLKKLEQEFCPKTEFCHCAEDGIEAMRDFVRNKIETEDVEGLVIVGGDGSIRASVPMLLDYSDISLTILPHGTGNLLARVLDIPLQWEKAFAAISSGKQALKQTKVPVVKVNDDYSLVAFGVGIDVEVMDKTSDDAKELIGTAAYFLEGIKQSFLLPEVDFELCINGSHKETITGHSLTSLVQPAIIHSIVPSLQKTIPQAKGDDGFYLLATNVHQPLDIPAALLAFEQKLQKQKTSADTDNNQWLHDDFIDGYYIRNGIKTLTLSTNKPVNYQLDGDPMGKTPIKATLLDRQLTVNLP